MVVRLLLEQGTDVAAKDNHEQTALHVAAIHGNEAVMRLLLEQRADVAAKDEAVVRLLFPSILES